MAHGLDVTPEAAERLRFLLKKKSPGMYLRVRVEGGGCSGLQYILAFDDAPFAESDAVTDAGDGALVATDAESCAFLENARLTYSSAVGDAAFKVVIPHAKSGCGCGASFSV